MKSHEILVLLLRLRQVCGHCGLIASMLDPDDTPVDEDLGGQDLLAELNKLTLNDQRSRRKVGVMKLYSNSVARFVPCFIENNISLTSFLLESNDKSNSYL